MGYSFRLTARVLLYAPSHRQDNTYHSLCYTSHRALAGTRNSSMGAPHEGSIRRPIAPWANTLTTELHLTPTRNSSMGSPHEGSIQRPITPWANAFTTELHLTPMRNSSMGPRHEGSIRWPIAPWANALTTELYLAPTIAQLVHPMKDRSDNPSHHERTLLPRSYISLQQ